MSAEAKVETLIHKVDVLIKEIRRIAIIISLGACFSIMAFCHIIKTLGLFP